MKIIIITDNSELIIHVQNNSNNDNNDHDHNDNITNDNVQNKKKKNDDSKERHGKIYTITYIAKKKKIEPECSPNFADFATQPIPQHLSVKLWTPDL